MCEDRDMELGVKPSDYTFCDVPAETEDNYILGTAEEVDLNRMASVGFDCIFKIGDGARSHFAHKKFRFNYTFNI